MYFNKQRLRLYLSALLIFQIATVAGHFSTALAGKVDFRTFYTAAHMVNSGHLYDYQAELSAQNALVSPNRYALPFMFPPYTALLFAPFAWVSYKVGYWIFFALNLGLCAASVAVMRPYCQNLRARWTLAPALLFLSFMPLGSALQFGQVSVFLLLLYCACFAAVQSERPYLAGIFLSLALIKFQIVLPIVLLFLIWRQWRFVAGFVSGAAALTLISIRITGLKGLFAYLHSLVFMASQTGNETKFAMFSVQMADLYGFFHTLLPGPLGYVLTIVGSLAVMVWAATRKPSLPLALLAGLLVAFHLYLYDLTLLLLPIVLIFNTELDAAIHNRPALYASGFMVLLPFSEFVITQHFQYLFAIPVAVLFIFLGPVGELPSTSLPRAAPANQRTFTTR